MSTRKLKFAAWLLWTLILYIFVSFISWDLNPANWHLVFRLISGFLFLVITAFYSSQD